MKIFFFFAGFLFFVFNLKSQNTFPNSGNVGIGTSTQTYKLHVQSTNEGSILVKSNSNGTYRTSNIIVDATRLTLKKLTQNIFNNL